MSEKNLKYFSYQGQNISYYKENQKWVCRLYIGQSISKNGKKYPKRKKFTCDTELKLKQSVKLYIDNNGIGISKDISKERNISEIAIEWFKNERINAPNPLKSRSLERIEQVINNQIRPAFGEYDINEITVANIDDELLRLSQGFYNGRAYEFSTLKKTRGYLANIYDYAIKKNYTYKDNPVLRATIPIPNSKKEQKEIIITDGCCDISSEFDFKYNDILTPDEIEEFKRIATFKFQNGKYKYRYGWGLVFILSSGLREGEALALQWRDIDFFEKTVNINKSYSCSVKDYKDGTNKRNNIISQPKTKASTRKITLNKLSVYALIKLKAVTNPEDNDNAFLFRTKNNKIVTPTTLYRNMKSILKQMNADKESAVHLLRHTFASIVYSEGFDADFIANELGHADSRITREVYINKNLENNNPNIVKLKKYDFVSKVAN